MKKLFTLLLVSLFITFTTSVSAQWIQSLTVLPPNPTVNDTITVLAECSFGYAGCDDHTQYQFVNGNTINAGALHCIGVLTIICDYTDTFKIAPLPVGNYTFNFQLDAGQLPSPCTPGIVAGPSDSVTFTVTLPTGIGEAVNQDAITAVPNPTNGDVSFKGLEQGDFPIRVEVHSLNGKMVMQEWLKRPNDMVDINHLAKGMFQFQLYTKSEKHYFINVMKE